MLCARWTEDTGSSTSCTRSPSSMGTSAAEGCKETRNTTSPTALVHPCAFRRYGELT